MGYEVKGEGKGELSVKDGNCNQDRKQKARDRCPGKKCCVSTVDKIRNIDGQKTLIFSCRILCFFVLFYFVLGIDAISLTNQT